MCKSNNIKQVPSVFLNLLVSSVLLFTSSLAQAEEKDVIATDRPDFVESSDVVGKGRFQVEGGIGFERNRADNLNQTTFTTPTLLRIGIHDAWELRLETDGRTISKEKDTLTGSSITERGYSDLSLGVKWHMQDGEGMKPGVGWLLHADFDSGSSQFRGNGIRPSLRMAAEWELPQDFSLGMMPGMTYDRNPNGERFVAGIFAVVLGKSWNDRFRTFAEFSAPQIASAKNGGSIVTFDIGAVYLLTNNCQVDMALYRGMNKNTPDQVWTIGLSIKF